MRLPASSKDAWTLYHEARRALSAAQVAFWSAKGETPIPSGSEMATLLQDVNRAQTAMDCAKKFVNAWKD